MRKGIVAKRSALLNALEQWNCLTVEPGNFAVPPVRERENVLVLPAGVALRVTDRNRLQWWSRITHVAARHSSGEESRRVSAAAQPDGCGNPRDPFTNRLHQQFAKPRSGLLHAFVAAHLKGRRLPLRYQLQTSPRTPRHRRAGRNWKDSQVQIGRASSRERREKAG